MGCSAAKNLAVEPLNGNAVIDHSGLDDRKPSIPRRESQVPPIEGEEPPLETLDNATVNNYQTTANGLSFELAFQDEGGGETNESIIRKHPPKRFQKLEDQEQTSPTISLEKLQEKLDDAEIRRQQILQQRIRSAKVRKALHRQESLAENGGVGFEEEELEDYNHLAIPNEIPRTPEPA